MSATAVITGVIVVLVLTAGIVYFFRTKKKDRAKGTGGEGPKGERPGPGGFHPSK